MFGMFIEASASLGNVSILLTGLMPPMPLVHPAFGTGTTFYMSPTTLIRRPDDMLSLPIGQHMLDYEPSHGFFISAFTSFDGSTNVRPQKIPIF